MTTEPEYCVNFTEPRRLSIEHRTGFRYESSVEASFNEVRMTPEGSHGQTLLSHELIVSPASPLDTYVDYWGSRVEFFDLHKDHLELEIIARSVVETPATRPDAPGTDWDYLQSDDVRDRWAEYLAFTCYVDDPREDPTRAHLVTELTSLPDPVIAGRRAIEIVRDHLQYVSGSTLVSTNSFQAWEKGTGVCQDFSHVTMSLLRAIGIPARYVSGYLDSLEYHPGQVFEGQSHAWIEYWVGGWQPADPTNDRGVHADHVVVGRGRDYGDVPPLKGIYSGGASEGTGVSVQITQL